MSDKFESQHSLSPTIWSDIVVRRESGYLKIFFTFLEVNMSNILWSMRICKTGFSKCAGDRRFHRLLSHYRQLKIYRAWVFQQFLCLCELLLSRFVNLYLLINYFYYCNKTIKSSSISLFVFTFRKGISQLLECDDCASFMSKYSTRNALRIYIVEPSEVRNVV
jgi:hypothetical protein